MAFNNLAKQVLENGGKIYPLTFPTQKKTALFNPSILVKDDRVWINVRHCQYTLIHTDSKWESRWGPLIYLNPENDITLTTTNFLCEWKDGELLNPTQIDTSFLDVKPQWEFVGLEDARLVDWNNKLYLTGVRRDTETTGIGRMELSEINNYKEVKRFRIPTPNNKESYCEKNWMPILDTPFHYVKWCNPVEIVKVNPGGDTEQVFLGKPIDGINDMRGGSQVISIGEHRFCIVHETWYWRNNQNNKDATYRHRILCFDNDWNIIHKTIPFNFMSGLIEFCCGLAEYKDKILITFGYSDNSAYLLELPKDYFLKLVYAGIE